LSRHAPARLIAIKTDTIVIRLPSTALDQEDSVETVNAIAYATRHHSDWFWKGAQTG
jgi:hypothetical protein